MALWCLTAWWGGVLALDAGRGGGLMSEADGLVPTVWRDGG
ncbi:MULTISPECIES: hypothetical protein [unclassified Streptomyces]|nr:MULTISPECIES: hypothetical protein [unclassified Streptomyces]MCX5048821.1 hypothetical protein [Streptomyces sp. NBC_00474]